MTTLLFDPQHLIIEITPSAFPDADEFSLWASIFLHHRAILLKEFEQGADRHLQRFVFEHQPYELHFEHYSQAIWISPTGQEAAEKMPLLHHNLLTMLQT